MSTAADEDEDEDDTKRTWISTVSRQYYRAPGLKEFHKVGMARLAKN